MGRRKVVDISSLSTRAAMPGNEREEKGERRGWVGLMLSAPLADFRPYISTKLLTFMEITVSFTSVVSVYTSRVQGTATAHFSPT